MEGTSERKFKVKTMDGRTNEFQSDPDISVPELKAIIESTLNIPAHRQRLIFKSRLLKDDQKLSDHINKDDETIHLMAMSEEQARTRSQTRANTETTQPTNQPNRPGGIPAGNPADPFSGIMGMLGNMMQGFNQNPGMSTSMNISSGPIDLTQLLAGAPITHSHGPASNSNNTPSQPATRPSQPTAQPRGRVNPNAVPVNQHATVRLVTRSTSGNGRSSRGAEENKETRSTSGTRTTNVALPHEHLYDTNLICNELMGPGSAFPGPPLPPSNQPRNPATLLGSYLSSLQFATQRVNSFIWRSGELMQRENNLVNPVERAEAQQLINQTGRAMESLARALLLSSHYYRDFSLGETPGNYRVSNNPHPDFADLHARFTESQFQRSRGGSTQSSTVTTSAPAPTPAASSSGNSQRPAAQANPFANLLQNIMTPQNLSSMTGLVTNLTQQVRGQAPQRQPVVTNPTQDPSSSQQPASNATQSRDVVMEPSEEVKNGAETRQQTLNSRFVNDISSLANLGNNPMGMAAQSLLPMLNSAMSGGAGGPLSMPIREMFADDSDEVNTFLFKVLMNCSMQDLIAIMNGNYEIVSDLHPRTRDVLMSDYMNGQDTPENREVATSRISNEINSQLIIPADISTHIVSGADPLRTVKSLNQKHVKKLVSAILDIDHDPNDSTAFINRMSRIQRWWIGDLIDSIKPLFTGQLQDALRFVRGNIDHMVTSMGDPTIQMMAGMFTDTIMQKITQSYNQYLLDKQREDEAEARELGISVEELHKRRFDSESEENKMEVDRDPSEEPKIQEEPVNMLRSNVNSAPSSTSHATPFTQVKVEEQKQTVQKEEEKVEEEKDPEIRDLLELMEEDQSMLVVNVPSKRPRSRAYKALDVYFDNNIESSNPITERGNKPQNARNDMTAMLKKALKDTGFKSETIDKNLAEVEIPDSLIDQFKQVIKEDVIDRKNDQEYKPGQFPSLDKL